MAFQQLAVCKIVGVGKKDRRTLDCCSGIDTNKPVIIVKRKPTWESKSKYRDTSRYVVQYTNSAGQYVIGYLSGRYLKQIGVHKGKMNEGNVFELGMVWE